MTARARAHLERLLAALVFSIHAAAVILSLACPLLLFGSTFFAEGQPDLAAWRNAFGDLHRWLVLLWNTGQALAVALLVSVGLGTLLGTIVFRTDAWLRGPVLALVLFAAAIPLYVTNSAIIALFGPENLRGSPVALGLVHGVAHMPLALLVVGLALRTVRRDLEESALIEGARNVEVLLRISARLARGGIAAAAVLVALWVTTDYSASDILLVRTFAEEVYTQFALDQKPQEATLVCLPALVLFALIIRVFGGAYVERDWASTEARKALVFPCRAWRLPLSLLIAGASLFLAGAPAGFLIDALEGSKGLGHYVRVFAPEIRTSFWTGLSAAGLSAILATGIAWYLARRRFRRLLMTYVALMLAFPGPLLGIALIQIFNRPGILGEIYDSPFMLVLAYVCRFLPVAVALLVPWAGAVPLQCEHAARVDGCGTLGVWWRVVMPLCVPGMLVALFVVLALSLGELPCSYLIRPPGYFTVGVTYFSKIHYGIYGDAAALCLLALSCIAVPWMGVVVVFRGKIFGSSGSREEP